MKKITGIFVLLFVMAIAVAVVSAQSGVPGSGWWSGEQVQNVGASTATITITAYDSQSSAEYSENKSINVGEAYTFTPLSDFADMPAGFQGSAVVSSDQPVKAIVNVTNQVAGSLGVTGGKAAGQYQGTDGADIATTLYFPLAKGDHYDKTTSFYVQNAGASDATSVVATFTMQNGDVHTYNVPTIGVNKMVVFSVNDTATYNPSLSDKSDRVGGLSVVGDQPLAGVVMEHDTSASVATVLNSTRGFTSASFDTKAYAPVVKNGWYGRFTGLQIQNTSGSPISMTVTYAGTGGDCAGNTYEDSATNVADGTSQTFVHLGTTGTDLPEECVGTATIEATGNFVAIVNEQETTGSPKAGITYSAINDSATTTKVSVPLFKDGYYGALTGLQIQNIGAVATTSWTATFNCTDTSSGTFTAISSDAKTGQIQPGAAYLFYSPSGADLFTAGNPFVSSSVNCAVTIVADQPIVAIVNEAPTVAGNLDDNNYEGFNLTP